MPQLFRIGSYHVYFWANESLPLEPVHVHISDGIPTANATKVWITKSGKCLIADNRHNIDEQILRNIVRIIEAQSGEIVEKWKDFFGEAMFYC